MDSMSHPVLQRLHPRQWRGTLPPPECLRQYPVAFPLVEDHPLSQLGPDASYVNPKEPAV